MSGARARGRDGLAGRVLLGLMLPAAVVLVWHAASKRSVVIPGIGAVLDVFAHPLREPPNLDCRPLLETVAVSLFRVLVGFCCAVLTAVPLGIAVGRSRVADRIVSPLLEALRPICPVAWIPVAVILFGFSSMASVLWGAEAWRHGFLSQIQIAMVFIIWWGAFFPILINTTDGVRNVRRLYIEAAQVLGASRRQVFYGVIFPASLPSIMTGLRVGMGLAWMVIVAAEFFPGTSAGLGYMITTSHQVAQYEYAFAAIIAIGVVGLAINAVMMAVSNRVGRWKEKER
ncbi:MAG: ABC transporter permease [Elusimicrobiota bacterium]